MSKEEPTPYERVGGEAGVRALVDRFYDYMEQLPEAGTIRAMHPQDLTESRLKLFEFLSGWLGGPQLYVEKRGHPRLRMRHMPFAIDDAAAQAWLDCMERALSEHGLDSMTQEMLRSAFRRMASHMRNQGLHQRPSDGGND